MSNRFWFIISGGLGFAIPLFNLNHEMELCF